MSPLVIKKIKNELPNYDAFVIACYSDPGLSDSKFAFSAPIYGIHETTVKFCHYRKIKFGVIALGEKSIKRHYEYIGKLNLRPNTLPLIASTLLDKSLSLNIPRELKKGSPVSKLMFKN